MNGKPPSMTLDYQEIFRRIPFPCLVLSPDLRILTCNDAYGEIAGRNREDLVSRYVFDAFPTQSGNREILESSFAYVREHLKSHQIPLLHYPIVVPDAADVEILDRYWTTLNVPLLDAHGVLQAILHHPTDITELTLLRHSHEEPPLSAGPATKPDAPTSASQWARGAQEVLKAERERLRQLFQQAPGFICVLRGPRHIYEMANDAYYQLIGHRRILGRALAEVLPEVIEQGYLAKLDRVFATGEPFIGRAMPIQLQREAGGPLEQSYIDIIYQPMRDAQGTIAGIFVQGHDVTEVHELAQEVTYQATHDSLTGLYNRREFARLSNELEKRAGTHGMLYMDLDHFKIVNDRGGHAAGDALLVQVANVLRQHINEGDLLARLGGDEFALILVDSSEKAAVELAHLLLQKVREIPFIWKDRRYSVTLSAGLVTFGGPQSLTFNEALALADVACFLAKEKGRNRVQLSLASDLEITQRQRDMDWVDRIKDCLREDRVVLHVQRFTAMQERHENGVECQEVLARLLDTDGKLVLPGAFIPPAERFALIEELDRHIIRKAFAKLHSLSASQRARTRYFINVSGITLGAPGFSAFVGLMLTQYLDVQPFNVCFEVTETAAIANLTHTAKTVEELVEQGFFFALDDFGSGMSSFSYLERLPVQYIKIDGEFIKGILTRPAGTAIVEAVVKVANAMNILTVAESVEFPELLPHLRRLGIDYGQGFALHRPEPL